jgi:hypothetical protein
MLRKTKNVPETQMKIDLQIGKNYNYNTYELVLTIGKNVILLKRSKYLKEIERIQKEFEQRSGVIWEEILIVGDNNNAIT